MTVLPDEPRKAQAGVSVDTIYTRRSILAGIPYTIIRVDFTVYSLESDRTLAVILADKVLTGSIVPARYTRALIDFGFTVESHETGLTLTFVSS